MYLTKAAVKRDGKSLQTARDASRYDDKGHPGHGLVWSLFDGGNGQRDFLWREIDRHQYLVLSAKPPADSLGVFDISVKEFNPRLRPDDRLRFMLRVNAVKREFSRNGRGPTHDIVMDALWRLPRGERAGARHDVVNAVGVRWLAERGERNGFKLLENATIANGYENHEVRRKTGRNMRFSSMDITGVLDVIDPDAFIGSLRRGHGKAKAFGCGLMLVRRA